MKLDYLEDRSDKKRCSDCKMQPCTSRALLGLFVLWMFGSYVYFVAYMLSNNGHVHSLSRKVTYLHAKIQKLQRDYSSLRHSHFVKPQGGNPLTRGLGYTANSDSAAETVHKPDVGRLMRKEVLVSQVEQMDGLKSFIDAELPPHHLQAVIPKRRNKRQATNNRKIRRNKQKKEFIQFEGYKPDEPHLPDNGIFTKWEMAGWAHDGKRKRKKSFSLNMKSGEVTIRTSGIYLMYAQIMMYGDLDQGFQVISNGKIIATCSMSSRAEVNEFVPDKNRTTSCSTIGIFQFDASNKVFLRQTTSNKKNRRVWLTNNQSYFGFVRLGDAVSHKNKKKTGNGFT